MARQSQYAYIVGVGDTPYSAHSEHSAEALAVQATLAAIADAGLEPSDVDGICSYPGHVGPETLIATLGLPDVRYRWSVNLGGASAAASLQHAAIAVLSGAADNILIYRAIKGRSGPRKVQRPSFVPGQNYRIQLEATHGWNTAVQRYAMLCRRYMFEYGLQRRHLGEYALTARYHANLNPRAQMYGRPLTMEDYLSSRVIADPYLLYDCCLETDGACAVIVSASAAAGRRGVRILAAAEGHAPMPDDLSNRPNMLDVGLTRAAERVWAATGLGPSDMDAAMIYDCFTFEVIHQLEAAGFAEHGKGGDFVADGGVRLGGRLPVNTHGGLMSEGHMAGLNHVIEATRQLRGECGPRQVPGARYIAVTGWGNLSDGSMAILGAEDA